MIPLVLHYRHAIVKKQVLTFILFFMVVSFGASQGKEVWNTLALVKTESKFDDLMGMVTQKATPLPPAQLLNDSTVVVSGFMIALDVKSAQSHFMFSRYPQNMCFFCGAAGPESAMQVFMKDGNKIPYSEDKVALKGVLQIQQNDASGLIYFLHDATLLKQ